MTHTIEFVYGQLSVLHARMHFRLYNSHRPSHLPTAEWQKSPEPLQMPMAVNEMTKATPSPMLRIRLLNIGINDLTRITLRIHVSSI